MTQPEQIGIVAARIAGIAFVIQGLFDVAGTFIMFYRFPGQDLPSFLAWLWPLLSIVVGLVLFKMAKPIARFLTSDLV